MHFIIYISEQNGQHENLNIVNRDWDHTIPVVFIWWGGKPNKWPKYYADVYVSVCVCVCVWI